MFSNANGVAALGQPHTKGKRCFNGATNTTHNCGRHKQLTEREKERGEQEGNREREMKGDKEGRERPESR